MERKLRRRTTLEVASATLAAGLGLGISSAWAKDETDKEKPAQSSATLRIFLNGEVVQELVLASAVADLVTSKKPLTIEIEARGPKQMAPTRVKFAPVTVAK